MQETIKANSHRLSPKNAIIILFFISSIQIQDNMQYFLIPVLNIYLFNSFKTDFIFNNKFTIKQHLFTLSKIFSTKQEITV